MKAHIEMLRSFADGGRRDVRKAEEIETAIWLYEQGFITGSLHRPLSGRPALLNARITDAGLQKLGLEAGRNRKETITREAVYAQTHPMRSQLVVGIAVILLGAVILAAFNYLRQT